METKCVYLYQYKTKIFLHIAADIALKGHTGKGVE